MVLDYYFSGYFNTDQTERAIVCIKNLIQLFETDDKTWIKGLEQNVFKVDYFTEKEFLLLNKMMRPVYIQRNFYVT